MMALPHPEQQLDFHHGVADSLCCAGCDQHVHNCLPNVQSHHDGHPGHHDCWNHGCCHGCCHNGHNDHHCCHHDHHCCHDDCCQHDDHCGHGCCHNNHHSDCGHHSCHHECCHHGCHGDDGYGDEGYGDDGYDKRAAVLSPAKIKTEEKEKTTNKSEKAGNI